MRDSTHPGSQAISPIEGSTGRPVHSDITGDALLTQRAIASYAVAPQAHYHFAVKGNQPGLESAIALLLLTCGDADFFEVTPPDHGRIETRSIWCSTALNGYLDFPSVGQVFRIERETIDKKTGARSREIALGITSRTPQEASPQRVLAVNRGHWSIESVHHIIDWNYDEDRSQIRTGFGPENVTRPRRFAVGILKSLQKPAQSFALGAQKLTTSARIDLTRSQTDHAAWQADGRDLHHPCHRRVYR